MAEPITGLACPNCSGTLEIKEGQRIVRCPYCDARSFVRGERGVARYQVARFSEWETSPTPEEYRYRITAQSLKRAAEQGLKAGHLLSLLGKHSGAHMVRNSYRELGIELADWQSQALLGRIRAFSTCNKRSPGQDELQGFYRQLCDNDNAPVLSAGGLA